ncbi:MAG: hypothetical protein K2X87_28365 [Gemmataceae bacterium]|nr:hypothetical protein [Gemmataceae bacterium]
MLRAMFNALVRGARRRNPHAAARFTPGLEALGRRDVPAVTAVFQVGFGVLQVFGDDAANTIEISRDEFGLIYVNGGGVTIEGGTEDLPAFPHVFNTQAIAVFGKGGNDVITLNESNGQLPTAFLHGNSGNDLLAGGSSDDQLLGQSGNDTLLGYGGTDLLFGGSGNDVLLGGDGDDQVYGQDGTDRLIWNPGDDTDLNEGGAGTDVVEVNGGDAAETFTIAPNGDRVRFDRTDPDPFAIDIGTSEALVVNGRGGDDAVTGSNGLAALIRLTIDGGTGDDTITGGDGNDTLYGGDGNDLVIGRRGDDLADLGAGDDVFVWNPGEADDTIRGRDGFDTMQFNGNGADERVELSAVGGRLKFTRDVANVTMLTDDLERVNFTARGGADAITVGDLSKTDVQEVHVDLADPAGGGIGDGKADSITLNGSKAADFVEMLGQGGSIAVVGLPTFVSITAAEPADALRVNGNAGDDRISATGLTTPVALTLDGGSGDDTIFGSNLADIIHGGSGTDFVVGRRGDDVADLGAGNDIFVWAPGDDNDRIEGGAGTDEMLFLGAGADEVVELSANGGRLKFTRDVANVVMDTDDVERVTFNAFGGADTVRVGDLSGTDVKLIRVSLIGGSGQANDGKADAITVTGTAAADRIRVSTANAETVVSGLPAQVRITGADPGSLDRLTVDGAAGDDRIDAARLGADLFAYTAVGGLGNDTFVGSAGNDTIVGGDGNDAAFMGAGDDVFVWFPGEDNDRIEGQAGRDEMLFFGNNASETVDISAVGNRVRFFRDVAAVTMDLNDTEVVTFLAAGGADTITVGDLSGTDVTEVNLNLAAFGGGGDAQPDTVVVTGTNRDDVIQVAGDATGVGVFGLAAQVNITGAEAATDRLVILALAGDDVVPAAGLAADAIQLTADGGAGDDALIGGDGADSLLGGDGDDFLDGRGGVDVLDGGVGDDIEIQ